MTIPLPAIPNVTPQNLGLVPGPLDTISQGLAGLLQAMAAKKQADLKAREVKTQEQEQARLGRQSALNAFLDTQAKFPALLETPFGKSMAAAAGLDPTQLLTQQKAEAARRTKDIDELLTQAPELKTARQQVAAFMAHVETLTDPVLTADQKRFITNAIFPDLDKETNNGFSKALAFWNATQGQATVDEVLGAFDVPALGGKIGGLRSRKIGAGKPPDKSVTLSRIVVNAKGLLQRADDELKKYRLKVMQDMGIDPKQGMTPTSDQALKIDQQVHRHQAAQWPQYQQWKDAATKAFDQMNRMAEASLGNETPETESPSLKASIDSVLADPTFLKTLPAELQKRLKESTAP